MDFNPRPARPHKDFLKQLKALLPPPYKFLSRHKTHRTPWPWTLYDVTSYGRGMGHLANPPLEEE